MILETVPEFTPETVLKFTTTAAEPEVTVSKSNSSSFDDDFFFMFKLAANQKGSEEDLRKEFIDKRGQLVAEYTTAL